MLQPLSIADASTMTGSSRLSCPGIVSGTTWCSIGQRREKGQGTAGWSATLQDFRQNTSFASKEYPDIGTEFGCKICILCADSLHPRKARFPSFHIVCRWVFASFDSSTFWLLSLSALFALVLSPMFYDRILHSLPKSNLCFRVHFRKTE